MEVVRDDTAYPEILWTFYEKNPQVPDSLLQRLEPGIDRGRVVLYSGIDCHKFFHQLYQSWQQLEDPVVSHSAQELSKVHITTELREEIKTLAHQQRVLEGYEEDRPPHVEICVGRDEELATLRAPEAKVVFLTGIGGQGKSTLAARYFLECQREHTFSVYVWRDCKEESERFENQLTSVIENLSNGRLSAQDLAEQSVSSVVEVLLRLIKNIRVLFVFDNADHYVDLETRMMTGSADVFIEALLDSSSLCRAVFTCRTSVFYDHRLAISRHLEGLSLTSIFELFKKRHASAAAADIEDAYDLTKGHAFWLDLLAIQSAKLSGSTDLRILVAEIRSGRGPLPQATLKSIWATLKSREQLLLRTLGETVKATTEEEIADYLRGELNYGKVAKALKDLKALNLIVVKRLPNTPDVLELHPLVREFIRQNFTSRERASVIDTIIKVYKRIMGKYKNLLPDGPPLTVLLNWTQSAELDVAAGRFNEAFTLLDEVGQYFLSSAYPREFCRVARLLLSVADWINKHHRFRHFEDVFLVLIRQLSYLGDYSTVDELEMKCFAAWVREDFTSALEWGMTGQSLKEISTVDTRYDLKNTFALAQRDAGQPEHALTVFLDGHSLAEIIDSKKFDREKTAAYYGNIGRCLHFMGQIESALVCYQKSALVLENGREVEYVMNQGFIRAWIGELLITRNEFELGAVFLRAACLKWEDVSPPRAELATHLLDQVKLRMDRPFSVSDSDAEKICLDWIVGSPIAIDSENA